VSWTVAGGTISLGSGLGRIDRGSGTRKRAYDSFCLFTCMPEYVVGEVLLAAKALAADLATERRLVGVRSHMVG